LDCAMTSNISMVWRSCSCSSGLTGALILG